MTIGEKLDASKDGLDALLTYANGVTGQTDPNIGDAIRTLCDGFGHGGGNRIEGTIIGDGIVHGYKNPLTFQVGFEPLLFALYLADPEPLPANHVAYALMTPLCGNATVRAANSTTLTNGGVFAPILGVPYNDIISFSYNSGLLTIYVAPASRVLYDGAEYKYIIIGG